MSTFRNSIGAGVMVAATLCALPALAETVSIQPAMHDIAIDNGPADGVFDSILLAVGPGNNGFSDIRYAAEFPLSAIPAGMHIDTATLAMRFANFEGIRSIELAGHAGDGQLAMDDFSANGDLGHGVLLPIGAQSLSFDVTAFLQSVGASAGYAGFNLRETPANAHNFLLFAVDAAQLNVTYSPVPLPSPAVLLAPAVGLLALRRRRVAATLHAG